MHWKLCDDSQSLGNIEYYLKWHLDLELTIFPQLFWIQDIAFLFVIYPKQINMLISYLKDVYSW